MLRITRLYFFLCLALLAGACQRANGPAPGTTPPPAPTTSDATPTFKIDYSKYTLDNGLEVVLHEDHSDPIAAVAILFNVGSNREKPGRTGFAHFFEHMLFQNSENVGKGNFFKNIEELGGDFNGGTGNDLTVYFEVVPKDALERILWMESDRMGFLINTVTKPVLENEKQVVKNEKRQRVDNQPYGHTSYVIDKALYPEGHPYSWQVIGSLEDLQAATIDDVKEFYNQYYGPNNATLVVAGDIKPEEVKKMVEKYFGEIPAKPAVEDLSPRPVQLNETIALVHEDNFAQLPELRLTWPTVEDGHPDSYALSYLGSLLSDGKRAPLYQILVEEKELAPSPNAYNSTLELAGEFVVQVRAQAGKDLDDVKSAVFEAFQRLEEKGIDDRDMERIKATLETDFYNGLSSILSKSLQLAIANELQGSPDALEKEIERILAVTKDDVMRVYNKYVKGKHYVQTSFVPKGQLPLAVEGSKTAEVVEEPVVAGAEAPPMEETEADFVKTPSKIDRAAMPALGEAPTINAPEIWTTELSNGLDVYGVTNEELPLVEFSIRLKGGMWLDDPRKVGVANLITDIMMEGTANKTPEELQDAIGRLGADISMSTSAEYITIEASTLERNFKEVLDLVEEIIMEPRWDAAEFERIKQATVAQIQQNNARPEAITNRAFNRIIYGDNNILAQSTLGEVETVQNATIDDLKAYYNRAFSPSVASFHIVGAVSKQETTDALASLARRWPAKEVKFPDLPKTEIRNRPQLFFVDVPDAKQSVIRIGMPAPKGNDPDFNGISIVNQRLGGGTSARLFSQLREEKGYTYGAYSGIPRRINESFFSASSSVRANVTKESVSLFRDILESYPKDYSEQDLAVTKSSLVRGNARAFETLGDKIGILENISTYDLPLDYVKKEEKEVQDMTLDRARQLINRYIDPAKMIYIVVGDAKTQLKPLEEVGLGQPIQLDRDGKPVNGKTAKP